MDTDEVIIEKVIINTKSDSECIEHMCNNCNVENLSSTCKESIENNGNDGNQPVNECEMIVIDNNETQQSCNEKSSVCEDHQEPVESIDSNQSDILIVNINNNQSETTIPRNEATQQSDDVCIVEEKIAVASVQSKDTRYSILY